MPSMPGRQHDREGQVWIAGRVGAAQLNSRRRGVTAADRRHADECRAVRARPGDVDRSLEARHEPPVGVDQRREHGAHAAGVVELTGDELLGHLRTDRRVVLVDEGVVVRFDEGKALVHVHAGAVDAFHRLRHEGGVQTMLLRDRLEDRT